MQISFDVIHNFSAHGTFIGNLRLEAKKPQQVPLDSIIRFGASTRAYVIRERPQAKNLNASEYDELDSNALPENEVELDVSVYLLNIC